MADFTNLLKDMAVVVNKAAMPFRDKMSQEIQKLVRKRVVVTIKDGAPVPWQGIDTFDANLDELNRKDTGEYELIFSDINCHGSNVRAYKSYDVSIDNILMISISL